MFLRSYALSRGCFIGDSQFGDIMSRRLLHISRFDAFKAWLDEEGIPHRPGKGDYQVLQVYIQNVGWKCIFSRHDMKEHYTVESLLESTVEQFIAAHKRPRVSFVQAAEIKLAELRQLINDHLKDCGDTEKDSQKIYLLNKLIALERAVNGVEAEDLK